MQFSKKQLEGAELVFLLVLRIRGRFFRFSTKAITVQNSDLDLGPSSLQFSGGLAEDVSFEESASPESSLIGQEVAISVLFGDDDGASWGEFAKEDYDLGDASAELSLLRKGDNFQMREILIDGRVESPTYGSRFEPLLFSIVDNFMDRSGSTHRPDQRVTIRTWPTQTSSYPANVHTVVFDETIENRFYPIIIGKPGFAFAGLNKTEFMGFPLYWVEMNQADKHNGNTPALCLIAGHACTASNLTVYDLRNRHEAGSLVGTPYAGNYKQTASISSVKKDEKGQVVSTCFVIGGVGPTALRTYKADPLFGSFDQGEGGALEPNTNQTMRGAGAVINFLLREIPNLILSEKTGATLNLLDGYHLDFFINEPVDPLDFVTGEILPLLPLSLLEGPDGVEFIFWNMDPSDADVVDEINPKTRGGQRASTVTVSSRQNIVNRLAIQFAPEADTGNYLGHIEYVEEQAASATPESKLIDFDIVGNPYSGASVRRYGVRRGQKITTSIVQDPATARSILDWQIRYFGQTKRRASYLMPIEFHHLKIGDIVRWTDDEIGIKNALSHVVAIRRAPKNCLISIQTVPNWIGIEQF